MKNKKGSLLERRSRYGYLFILPIIIGALFIFIPNIIETVRYSLSEIESGAGFTMQFKGFGNYVDAIRKDAEFLPLLWSNVTDLVVEVPVILIFSLFISTLLNQEFKGRVIARIIFFIPVILAAGALAQTDSTALYYGGEGQIIDSGAGAAATGLSDISSLMSLINFPKFLTEIVTDAVDNIYEIVTSSGIQIFIFLAGLQEIPHSVYEAAEIEGCSKWELFWKITFPMISPHIAVNAVYTIAISASTGNTLLDYAQDLAFNQNKYALATSMNVLYLLVLAAIVMVVLFILKKFTSNTEG